MTSSRISEDNRSKKSMFRFPAILLYLVLTVVSCGGGGGGGDSLNSPPGVTTADATSISFTGAVLNGFANPKGLATEAWFEWGSDPNLAGGFITTTRQNMGSGTAPLAYSLALSGLNYGTTYYFRSVAENVDGRTEGTIKPLTTPDPPTPTATTSDATNITTTGATLNGSVIPNGFATDVWFEYGTDPTLTTNVDNTALQSVGSGSTAVAVNKPISGLTPYTTYYFRLVASSVGGTQKGSIKSFPTGAYYVAVGDSITFGSGDNNPGDGIGFEPILQNLLTTAKGYPHIVAEEGFPGDASADGAAKISSTLSLYPSANYVLILYGTNDAFIPAVPSGEGWNIGDPEYNGSYKDNIQRIISAVFAAQKTPYLAKVLYTTDSRISIASIQAYNRVIDELVLANGIAVTPPNFYTYFQTHQSELPDGIHPNGTGYQSMANLWAAELTP